MSKKGKDTPTSTRIRENQRRSRERRAELITSLQQRVHEYESRGVQATLEMQRAARKVAQENMRLRNLLASRGVERKEVDEYLRGFDEEGERSGLVVDMGAMIGQDCRKQANYINGRSAHHQDDASTTQRAETHLPLPPSIQASSHAGTEECPNTAECFCPPSTITTTTITANDRDPRLSSGLEISCETAATIIAEMHGEGDRDREAVRQALGCRGEEECRVRNSEVLGILGER